jgi:hypothetical protein
LSTSDTQRHPRRMLSSGFTLAVTIGGIIGLGILRTPGEVAAVVPDPVMFVSLWVLGGLFILLSTVTAAELVGMTPRSGGTYALMRRAYGPFPGFVIGSVPYSIGYVMLEGVIRAGKNIVDISYFLEDPFGLDDLAKEMGVTAVVDCGLAPFEYKSPFPVLEVLEEYAGSARRVEDGKVVVEPMLSETATIDFEGIGPLACLNSDGLRTLIRTMDIPDMFEKTLRYPGHRDVMHIFKDAGFLNLAPIQVEGASVRPTSLS